MSAQDRLAAGIEAAMQKYERDRAAEEGARADAGYWEQFDLDSVTLRVAAAPAKVTITIDGTEHDLDPDDAQGVGSALIRAAEAARMGGSGA